MYAITPRFAATSTPGQLEAAGALKAEHPDCFLQSHVSESRREVAWIRKLFPERKSYLDVYDHYRLLGRRTIYGHGIWLAEAELQRCHQTGTAIAHCPTSNFFLGSGYFDCAKLVKKTRPVRVGLATDLGAGTSLSMLQTMSEVVQGRPAAWPLADRRPRLLSGHARRGARTLSGGHDRQRGAGNGGRPGRARPQIDSAHRVSDGLRRESGEALFIQMRSPTIARYRRPTFPVAGSTAAA